MNALAQERLQAGELDAVRFARADGDVIDHVGVQTAQRRNQQRRGRLPVDVEIAPDANAFVLGQRAFNSQHRLFHIRQFKCVRGGVGRGGQECQGFLPRGQSAADQRLSDQSVAAGYLQCPIRRFQRAGFNP